MSIKDRLDKIENPKFAPRLYSIAAIIAVIILSGIWLVSRFTEQDLERDVQNWGEKLNLIAESRSEALHDWVEGYFTELRSLADNPSLQLYLTQLQNEQPDNQAEEVIDAAQKSYLRNALLFTAERNGFSKTQQSAVNANVETADHSGLAIFDKNHKFVVSTAMTPEARDMLMKQAAVAPAGKENFIDIQKIKGGQIIVGFVVPVYAIQGERTAESEIGKIAGILLLEDKLKPRLTHPAITEKTLEAVIARKTGNTIEFLSELQDGSKALGKQIGYNARKFAEAALIQTPGNFLSRNKDYRDRPVLATSRSIDGTPWTLIIKIDKAEALKKSNEQRAGMVAFFFMLLLAIVFLIIAIWWYAHSKRSMLMSHHFKKMARQAIAQEELLTLVTNNQPESLYILDDTHIYHFANTQAAENANTTPKHLKGKNLLDVQGAARGGVVARECDKALAAGTSHVFVDNVLRGEETLILRQIYIPLTNIPIHTLSTKRKGVLVVEQNITREIREKEKRIQIQQQLVQSLVRLVDKRDPFAGNHSALVSMIAKEVAADMELSPEMVETIRIAGSLMNIGKVTVSPELLTKSTNLTDEEKKSITQSMHNAADIIKDIDFDGPVADTLRQWQERYDGKGPLGMKGEDILISARIIAVANAFIGMISPRSWRDAMTVENANKFLMEHSQTLFDRKVVAALINHVENHKGRRWIEASIGDKKNTA